jgi:hypothetical protein
MVTVTGPGGETVVLSRIPSRSLSWSWAGLSARREPLRVDMYTCTRLRVAHYLGEEPSAATLRRAVELAITRWRPGELVTVGWNDLVRASR